jgi:hypothetical protein
MAQLGADVEQLDRLARTFETEATRLERSATTLRSLVASVTWMGPDAGQFRGQFNQGMSQQLAAAARALLEEARHLTSQAAQQRVASDDGTGVGAGVVAGAGAGAGGGGGGSWGGGGASGGWRFGAEASTFTGARAGDGEAFAGAEARGEVSAAYGDLFSTRAWAEGQAGVGAEGSADFTMGDGRIEGEAEGYAFAGLRGEVGQQTSLLGGRIENESTLSGLLGAEAEGNGSFHLGMDGFEAEAEARAFAGARAAYSSDTSLFGDFAGFGTEAYAEAGASAAGDAHLDVGPLGLDTGAGFDVFAGARAGADGEINLFNDNVGLEGGVGVRAGVGLEADAQVAFGMQRVGAEVDLGAALGLGFDASLGFEFSPSGLATDAADLAGNVAGGLRDAADDLPLVGGLFR